jgi:hypothetical protein
MYISIQNKKNLQDGLSQKIAKKIFLLIHAKNKYKCLGRSPGYILFFDKFFDPSPLASWGTINTNPVLQQPNNYTYYPFHVASK